MSSEKYNYIENYTYAETVFTSCAVVDSGVMCQTHLLSVIIMK